MISTECPIKIKADLRDLGIGLVDTERNRRKRDGGEEAINSVWGWTDKGEGCVCVCEFFHSIQSFSPQSNIWR